MAIQNRRGNFADFDKFKMLPGEFAYVLDREELYYCVTPGNVRRCATKEDIIQILDTNQEAYNGLQQLLTELENETVASEILNDISDLLNRTAQNESKILENEVKIVELDQNLTTHKAESVSEIIDSTRDLTLTGGQTITLTKGKIPKTIKLMGAVVGTKKSCESFADESGVAMCKYIAADTGDSYIGGGTAIFADSILNRTIAGTIKNITENSFEITWFKTGTGATGNAKLVFLIQYHGE